MDTEKKENMDTPKRQKEKSLAIGLVALISIIVILALIGFFLLNPGPEIIQGQAEATQVRVSGKLPGRIVEFMVEEGESVQKGDTVVRIFSSDAEAKLMQATAMENVYKAQNQKVDKGTRIEVLNAAYDMWQQAVAGLDIARNRMNVSRTSMPKALFQPKNGTKPKPITKPCRPRRVPPGHNMKWPRPEPR